MSALCPQCRSPIAADGECQVCLLQLGFSQSSNAQRLGQLEYALPTIEELSVQFPQLEIRRLIGRGGMGAIYQARQTTLDRDVALKLIAKEVSNDPMFIERFEREAKALAKLSHPNIVTVFDFGRTKDGMAFLIMEFVDGVNLREAIATRSVGSGDALDLIATMCQALEYAHGKGVVHRDIKPENILLGEDGALKIADFGIAKIVDDRKRQPTLTATRQVLGSLHYLAPEQIESPDQVDHRVDLYALGVVFYELLTGQLPLGNFEPPSAVVPQLDKRVDAIVMKTLSRKPAMRYQNAQQLQSDINLVRTGTTNSPASDTDSGNRQTRKTNVPFEMEAMGGFAKIIGLVSATSEALKIEYRIADSIVGTIKSQLNTLEIPLHKISYASIKHGVFSSTLTLVADTASTFGKLPESETGRVQLSIAKTDRMMADQVLRAIGFLQPNNASNNYSEQPATTAAILLMVCALLNAGFLAIAQVAIESLEGGPSILLRIGISVAYGMLVMLQLVGGFIHLVSGLHSPLRAAMVASMVPLTPVAIFSFPLAVWYFQQTAQSVLPLSSPRADSWGATTMIYLRENRHARLISALNVLGILVFACSLAVYVSGLYPATLRYRIVGSTLTAEGKQTADGYILRRLADVANAKISEVDIDRITISLWNRQRKSVISSLKIEKCPKLVVIATDSGQGELATQLLDLAGGVEVKSVELVKSATGQKIACSVSELLMEPSMAQRITGAGNSLVIEWTSKGRKALSELLGQVDGPVSVGLVIDEVVQGVAVLDDSANQKVVFKLAASLNGTAESIVAAIRGPEFPFELELIQ